MTPIKLDNVCSFCDRLTDVPEGSAGTELKCTNCGAALTVEIWDDDTATLMPMICEAE